MRRVLGVLALWALATVAAGAPAGLPPQAQQGPAAPAPPGYTISGTVVDAVTGAALPGARLSLSPVAGSSESTEAVAGEGGRFVFNALPAGKFALTAEAKGYRRQAFHEHALFSSAIVAGPNVLSDNLVFRLARSAAISGRVVDEQGDPVTSANVELRRRDTQTGTDIWRGLQAVQTADDGSYRFSRLSPGKYLVRVSAVPWYAQHPFSPVEPSDTAADTVTPAASPLDVVYPLTYFGDATDEASATPIVLQPGQRAVADVTLRPVPALRVRLKTPLTEAGFGASIAPADGFGGSAQAGQIAPGVFEIVGLRPGHYDVTLNGNGPKGRVRYVSAVDVGSDGQVQVRPAAPAIVVGGVIKIDAGAAGPRPAGILLRRRGSPRQDDAAVSDKGEFTFANALPAGKYRVSLLGQGRGYIRKVTAAGARVAGGMIELAGSDSVRLELLVGYGEGEVQGIALKEGRPFMGAMVILVPQDPAASVEEYRRDQSDGDGTFTLPSARPGRYTLIAIENAWEMEWANPDVLKPYLSQGVPVQVEANGKYAIKVNVQ